ncbi:hypothetical protein C8R44DRAFT_725408 [Mycena epipterygia]|nr:hypothetical protein C8R44DRAFT_725408 [Mycena epipterygia]
MMNPLVKVVIELLTGTLVICEAMMPPSSCLLSITRWEGGDSAYNDMGGIPYAFWKLYPADALIWAAITQASIPAKLPGTMINPPIPIGGGSQGHSLRNLSTSGLLSGKPSGGTAGNSHDDCGRLIPIKGQKSEPGVGRAGRETGVRAMGEVDAWRMSEVDVRGCGTVLVFARKVSTSAQLNMHTAQVAVHEHLARPLSGTTMCPHTRLHNSLHNSALTRIEGIENTKIKASAVLPRKSYRWATGGQPGCNRHSGGSILTVMGIARSVAEIAGINSSNSLGIQIETTFQLYGEDLSEFILVELRSKRLTTVALQRYECGCISLEIFKDDQDLSRFITFFSQRSQDLSRSSLFKYLSRSLNIL